jgi:hypothetical protein
MYPGSQALKPLCLGRASLALQIAQFSTPFRRKHRSSPEREISGLRSSRTTASRSSSETAASCARQPQRPPGRASMCSEAGARRMAAILDGVALAPPIDCSRASSEAFCRTVPASSWFVCEGGSAGLHPVANVPQSRSCHGQC